VGRLVVGGDDVVRDGRLVGADEDALVRALHDHAARIAA
jgi:hypothetical protein